MRELKLVELKNGNKINKLFETLINIKGIENENLDIKNVSVFDFIPTSMVVLGLQFRRSLFGQLLIYMPFMSICFRYVINQIYFYIDVTTCIFYAHWYYEYHARKFLCKMNFFKTNNKNSNVKLWAKRIIIEILQIG